MGLLSLLLGGCQRQPADSFVVVEYLVVGAGGGGGDGAYDGLAHYAGGGGGAGGLLTGARSFEKGFSIGVEVGVGGGYYVVPGIGYSYSSAGNSSLDDIVAFGGGGGGAAIGGNGQSGGSGGGGAQRAVGASNGLGGAGVSGQGTSGTNGSEDAPGAGGGAQTDISITGSSVVYAAPGSHTNGNALGYPPPEANTGNGGGGEKEYETGNLIVEGAGVEGVDGVYTRSQELFNGRYEWFRGLQSTGYQIRWMNPGWRLNEASIAYYLLGEGGEPSSSGATAVSEDYLPVPAIRKEIGLAQPQDGASGVVILAVPGDPPATATGTYTKSTTSRPGYAVYKWTEGSGSITFT